MLLGIREKYGGDICNRNGQWADRPAPVELANLLLGPRIVAAGIFESTNLIASSPPSAETSVVFPSPLPGGADKYAVIITTLNGGYGYVTAKNESGGNFVSFEAITEAECDVMYIVVKTGFKAPTVN